MIPIFDKPSENDYDIPQNMYYVRDTGNGRPGYVNTIGLSSANVDFGATHIVRGMTKVDDKLFVIDDLRLYWLTEAGGNGSSSNFLTATGSGIRKAWIEGQGDYVAIAEPGEKGVKWWHISASAAGVGLSTVYIDGVCYQDGYFIAWAEDESNFYISSLNTATAWSLLDFEGTEYRKDKLMSMASLGENLYAFGEHSLEIYYNSGNSDFPFVRLEGGVFDVGCIAPQTLITMGGTLYFLADDLTVRRLNGFNPERISTPFIETQWKDYLQVENAYAWTYEYGGDRFYVLSFPTADFTALKTYVYGKTFVYNETTGLWHKWVDTTGAIDVQHPATCQAEFFANRKKLIGTRGGMYSTVHGGIYRLGSATGNIGHTFDGSSLERYIYTPIIEAKRERMFFNEFELYAKEDVGATSVSPSLTLSWSDDRGTNFSTGRTLSLGTATGGSKVITAHRLGTSYDRIFRLKSNHGYENVIYGGYLR